MAAVQRFCESLKHAAVFLDNLQIDGEDMTSLRGQQIESLEQQIAALPLDLEGGAALTTCINAGSWLDHEKKTLIAAAYKGVASTTQAVRPSNRNQRCVWFERYLCDSDWDVIMSDKPLWLKVAQMIYRAGEINLVLPCPHTIGRMVSILLSAGRLGAMGHAAAFKFYEQFRDSVKKDLKAQIKGQSLLWDYPMDPESVSTQHVVYKTGREPSMEYENHPAISTISNDLALRRNNNKLKETLSANPPNMPSNEVASIKRSSSVDSSFSGWSTHELGASPSREKAINEVALVAWRPNRSRQLASGGELSADDRWKESSWGTWRGNSWWESDDHTPAPALGSAVGNAKTAEQAGLDNSGQPKEASKKQKKGKRVVFKRPSGKVGVVSKKRSPEQPGRTGKYGCPKCRWRPTGCGQCRDRSYTPRILQKKKG